MHNAAECTEIFEGFRFEDLRSADPPDLKGVYVIRVEKNGIDIEQINSRVNDVLRKINWPLLSRKVNSRLARLSRMDKCPYIYIGSAGPKPGSKHTLRGRYRDFSARHTAMYPLWALLYFGWDLEYGWLVVEDSARLEEELKSRYRRVHDGRLPALVSR